MCGIVGIVSHKPVNEELYEALSMLQHRGQDAAGIMTHDEGRLYLRKDNGLVRDVFSSQHMRGLKGNMGIGHNRYPTAGCESSAEAQPFYVNSPYGITMAHNGNLTNAQELKRELFQDDLRHINTDSDSEILLNVFAHELDSQHRRTITEKDIFSAIAGVHKRCTGGYAVVGLIANYGVFGFRDPNGIRPVCFGKRETDAGTDYIIASESVALDMLGFDLIRDIAPGEAIYITTDGQLHTFQCAEKPTYSPCLFEFVYLARPDSIIDGISVYKARLRMGEKLASKILRKYSNLEIDVVIPIPDTSRTSALQLANHLGVKYREGFIKNRYIGRTFIMPGQKDRKKSVRQKLNAIDLEFKDKNVLLVDDSIVRGTTSKQIIQMAREAGAKNVYFASAAPPVSYPNVYGIDMPSAKELVAHNRSMREINEQIGSDWLIYQDLDDLVSAVNKWSDKVESFDDSVFSGQYVTGDINENYLKQLELLRNDSAKKKRNNVTTVADDSEAELIDMHNAQ